SLFSSSLRSFAPTSGPLSVCPTLFVFTATATTEIYTLSLHDALPILVVLRDRLLEGAAELLHAAAEDVGEADEEREVEAPVAEVDRKSTRLNSSHGSISYAVFCLKKKKNGKGHGNTGHDETEEDSCHT